MKRQSLSASLGSWYFQLAYRPRQGRGASAGEALVFLPAYAAIAVGVGAGCYALGHFITLGLFTSYLFVALVLSLAISFGARCNAPFRRLARAARWPMVVLILALAASTRFNSLLPVDGEAEGNAIIAVFVGFTAIVSVLLVGAKSGGKLVPLSAPLVPGLSLFGLLCLISVDSVIEICFLIFVASAIYLLSYERLIRRFLDEEERLANGKARESSNLTPISVPNLTRWATQCLLVCSVWFGLFMLGGMALYYPVRTILPRVLTPHIEKVRAATQGALLDYRGSSSVMELRGGTYALSDREIMRITVNQGTPSGLWKGRVYTSYTRSRWSESSPLRDGIGRSWRHRKKSNLPVIAPALGEYREVMEYVQPLDAETASLYASGQPVAWHLGRKSRDDGFSVEDDPGHISAQMPYLVRSRVIQPRFSALANAPGLSADQRAQLAPESLLAATLALPEDEETRRTLSAISQQILLGQRRAPTTPFQKVGVISQYLHQNCTYSLQAPSVPSNRDAVTFFLTDSRSGACDMFASSMALLLRTMNVPARVATGYLQPSAPIATTGEVSKRPTYLVRERDAHAWVEYYVPKLGWLTYDPTSGTQLANDNLPSKIADYFDLPAFKAGINALILPILGVGLLMIGLLWTIWEKRDAPASPAEAERARIVNAYDFALKKIARRVPHPAHLTPQEYESLVSRAPDSRVSLAAKQEFAALTHLYVAALYAESPPKLRPGDLEGCVQRFKRAL